MVSGHILINMINPLHLFFISLEGEEKSSPETKLKGEPEYGGWINELKLDE